MGETSNKIEPLIIQSFAKGAEVYSDYSVNQDGIHGKFYIPVYKWPEQERRVLNENWNLKDIRDKNGIFQTYVEANFKLSEAIVKVMYSNQRYEWTSIENWQNDPKYIASYVTEFKLKPYFYTDDYGQSMIAGQLKFMEIHIDEPLYKLSSSKKEDKLNQILNEMESKLEEPAPVVASESTSTSNDTQLINVVKALGYTPKEAIKALLEVI